jgi:hypothetical protein
MATWASTGISGLDTVLCHLLKGDNVVWQVDSVEDYRAFVRPYVSRALQEGRRVIYIRFAEHPPVIDNTEHIRVCTLDPTQGFETFSTEIHNIISEEGLGAYYVFDCLSDLLSAWATDLMIGNFFMVTCPYLYELDTVAYFGILRNHHAFHTIARIRETTQVLLDVYRFEGRVYVHPLKVWNRYSPTMFLPHFQKADEYLPLTSSIEASKLLWHISQKGIHGAARRLDYWDRLFLDAEELLAMPSDSKMVREMVERLCRIMVAREKRICELAARTLTLEDLINIKSRLIGSGFIGGKAAGMLIARRILLNDPTGNWQQRLEPHDSFYIGSDVFYTYIVENGWWKLFMRQKTKEGYFEAAAELKERMLKGRFSEPIRQRFQEIVEYFGQSPMIVRSSSLLEDSFGNAFAGKYESLFLVNQCSPDERQAHFEETVRRIFGSTMGEDALLYRRQRGLDEQDEQMALLIQRVSGAYQKHYFFPTLAGVGVSYNTFVWRPHLDPKAGMLRLVFGLGTRAVNRVEDDYPQTIALDDPLIRPHSGRKDAKRFSQHKVDVLDAQQNTLASIDLHDLLQQAPQARLDLIVSRDYEAEDQMRLMGRNPGSYWLVDFKALLSNSPFVEIMQSMLKTLETYYAYPVDVEFTANFTMDGQLNINLVQCRPLQTKGLRANVQTPSSIDHDKILLSMTGGTMGGNIFQPLECIIYVDPAGYVALPQPQKYELARCIGKLNRLVADRDNCPTLLMGPGRWGTSTPSLGVPVSFSEINRVTALAEVAYDDDNLSPDLSFGSHFFQDLVESDIFYLAVFPQAENTVFKRDCFFEQPSSLSQLIPEAAAFERVIRVWMPDEPIQIASDLMQQKTLIYRK